MGLYVNPIPFQNDEKGRTTPFARLDFYVSGTFNRKNTYADAALTVLNSNPVVADGAGRFPQIFMASDEPYRVVFSTKKDASEYTGVWTADGVSGLADATDIVLNVASIADLPPVVIGNKINVTGYQPGSIVGGGGFVGKPHVHDGITAIDPTRTYPTPAEWANGSSDPAVIAWYATTGGTVDCWVRINIEYLTPEMAGAVGDGVAPDRAAVAAFHDALLTGYRGESDPSKNYNLGAFADAGDDSRFVISSDGYTFNTNNCTFTVTASVAPAQAATDNQSLFKVADASRVHVGDFKVVADQVDRTSNIGVIAVAVRNTAANTHTLTVGDVTGTNLSAGFSASTADASLYRLKGVTLGTFNLTGCYYGVNCANNADDLTAKVVSDDIIRSYFPYGVDNHKVIVDSSNHASFTDILIKRYGFDTSNIEVLYKSRNDLSADAGISIEHQNTADDGVIRNVTIILDQEKATPAHKGINIASYDDGGSLITDTNAITDNVTIRGKTNSLNPLLIQSRITGENVSRVIMDKNLMLGILDTKGFIFKDTERKRWARADSSTDLSIEVNVSDLIFTPTWAKVRLYSADSPNNSAAEYFCRELWVLFSVAGDGSVTVLTTQVDATFTAGALGPTLTIASQPAGTYKLKLKVNNYVSGTRLAEATVDIFDYQF